MLVCPAKKAQTVIKYAFASAVTEDAAKTTEAVVSELILIKEAVELDGV
jgi:hypothetical protein